MKDEAITEDEKLSYCNTKALDFPCGAGVDEKNVLTPVAVVEVLELHHSTDMRPNGPALSCRPPVSVPRNDRRPRPARIRSRSSPSRGRRLGAPAGRAVGGRSAAAPC